MLISWVSGKFQKPSHLCANLGSRKRTAWRHNLGCQATHAGLPSFLGFVELPSGDEHPPGDANQFWFDFKVLSVLG